MFLMKQNKQELKNSFNNFYTNFNKILNFKNYIFIKYIGKLINFYYVFSLIK